MPSDVTALDERIDERVRKAMDDAEADGAKKQKLYTEVSRHIGSFEVDKMDLQEFAKYALKKLASEVELPAGTDPVAALEAYLAGRAATRGGMDSRSRFWGGSAQDSADGDSFLDRHLAGK